jgi:DNA excision repair protein ERCC-2
VGPRRARCSVLCLRNVVPAPLLRDRWAAAHSVTLFSATLHPASYHLDMLGLADNTVCVDVPTPFAQNQLAVQVTRHISTRYADRERSLDRVVEIMATQYGQQPGNYLAFFSSFDYLQRAADRFCAGHPDVPVWLQSRRMAETERAAFVDRFAPEGRGIGFAVLGGAFGEGIDLPGSRLIGAFVATLGLPQVNPVNEQFRQRVEASLGHGYDYTYLIPGLQKVVQAAGRVIRTLDDRGTVVLMDDRFARAEVRALLPAWWQIGTLRRVAGPADEQTASSGGVTESGDARANAATALAAR